MDLMDHGGITRRKFYLPELCFRLEGRAGWLTERVAGSLRRRLFEEPVGSRPAVTVTLRCDISESQPIAAGKESCRLEHGFRYWIPGGGGDRRRSMLGNGQVSAEILEHSRKLSVAVGIRPGRPRAGDGSLECFLDHLVDLLLPRLGFYPLEAGVARSRESCPTLDPRLGRSQVVFLGPAGSREVVLEILRARGWSVSDRPILCLREGEGGVYLVGGGEETPVLFPRTILFIDESLQHPEEGIDREVSTGNRIPAFRNIAFHLLRASRSAGIALHPEIRRARDRVLARLLDQTRPVKTLWQRGDAAVAARSALTLLGLRESRGWDLASPKTRVLSPRRPLRR